MFLEDFVRSGSLLKYDSDLKSMHNQKHSNDFKTEKNSGRLDRSTYI